MAGLVILAHPFLRQTGGDSPGSRYLAAGALPERDRPVPELPLLLRGSKASGSRTLSRTALPAPACQGCWWDPSSDAAPVGVQCGPAAFPKLGAGSSQWVWSRGEGGNERLGGSAAAEQSFEGAGGRAGWSGAGREAEPSTTSSAARHSRGQRPQLPAAPDDSKCEVWD